MKFLIIDNYDSFVYNIAQYMGELDVDCEVRRNDRITLEQIKQNRYDAIIISPGPGTPEDKKIFWNMFRGNQRFGNYHSDFRSLSRTSRNYSRIWRQSHKCKLCKTWKDQPGKA